MTRKLVYGAASVAFLATFAMTLASIAIPNWISFDTTTPSGNNIHNSLGLHSECRADTSGGCQPFPDERQCREDRTFCNMWRTVGFIMSFTVVLQGMALVAFVVLMSSGVQKRLAGRPVICSLLSIIGVLQVLAMAIIAYLYDHDERFFPGWRLDESWILCTTSWVVSLATALGVWISAYVLPMEGDYEMIPGDE